MSLLIRKESLWTLVATLCGFAMGMIWLFPFYASPIEAMYDPPLPLGLRTLRMLAPVIVGLISLFSEGGFKLRVKDVSGIGFVLMFSTFILFPAASVIKSGMNQSQIAFGLMPLAVSFLSAWMIMVAPAKFWRQVMIGIGLLALGLIVLRISKYGFEVSRYYTRPRAHLGFNHPLVTSAAILSCLWCTYLIPGWKSSRPIHAVFLACPLIVAAAGLIYADSRNSLLFLTSWGFGALFWMIAKSFGPLLWRVIVLCFWLSVPLSLLLLAWTWQRETSGDFAAVDAITSGRLSAAGQIIDLFTDQSFTLIGSSWLELNPKGINGFAVADSVFLSYWGHFGFISTLFLLAFWLWLGLRLWSASFYSSIDYIGAGAWFGLTGYFLFDGQGLTVSNLALFIPLAWLLRICIIRPANQNMEPFTA